MLKIYYLNLIVNLNIKIKAAFLQIDFVFFSNFFKFQSTISYTIIVSMCIFEFFVYFRHVKNILKLII